MNERLIKVIKEVFNIENEHVDENWTSNDIAEWDSIGHLNLILGIEKEFNVKIEIEEMFEVEKLGDIPGVLMRKGCL